MRRKYGAIAYIQGLHEQNGLLHCNYHTLSDIRFDPDIVRDFWIASLPLYLRKNIKDDSIYAEPAISEKKTVAYLLKYGESEPEAYLPERGRYRKIFFTSPNYNDFLIAHLYENGVDEIVGEW